MLNAPPLAPGIQILVFRPGQTLGLPLLLGLAPAGFPSPAEDYLEQTLDLNEHLVAHPAATYFVRVSGESMTGDNIHSGDILVVDRAKEAINGKIVIAAVNGELTVKRLRQKSGRIFLEPANQDFQTLEIMPGSDFEIWGVVTYIIHKA